VSRLPRIHILTPSLVPYDAIGNDATQMRETFLRRGYPVRIFAEGIHPRCTGIAEPLSKAPAELWQSPEDILIYHHSMGWGLGEAILFKAKNRIFVRYHNVTPPRFFARYSLQYQHICTAGLDSTRRIARRRNMTVLGDSTFNCEDMIALGAPPENCRVLAPLHLTKELGREPFDIPTIQRYSGEMVNILFVGGIKPNKGHARAIRAFAGYHHQFNSRSRLIFAGGIDDRLRAYIDNLRQLAASLGVADQVIFTGSVTGSQLKSLYVTADVFLCTSEHEGFCVPLVEAMYFRVPIVAWGKAAVPETIGGCGFVLEHWDEVQCASYISELVNDTDLATRFGDLGRKRYEAVFSRGVLRRKLLDIIAGSPQRESVSK
jgi:glycosyltransferase involved in cell wall biosynthesis